MNNQLLVILILGSAVALFALIGWIVWMDSRRRQANFRAATEFRHKLLDKFSTATEFIEFIKAEEGQRFLNLPTEGRPGPLDRVLRWALSQRPARPEQAPSLASRSARQVSARSSRRASRIGS
jgi:hypothetical protein